MSCFKTVFFRNSTKSNLAGNQWSAAVNWSDDIYLFNANVPNFVKL